MDGQKWPDGATNNIMFGIKQVHCLSQKFRLSERKTIHGLRNLLQSSGEIPENIIHLACVLNTVAISSSEYGRGFSQPHSIVTPPPQTLSLLIENVKDLLFRIVGTTFHHFQPLQVC